MTRAILLIVALTVMGSEAADAQSVYQILSMGGLIGTWSSDCAQAASPDYPRLVFSAPQTGRGSLVYDRGSKGEGTSFTIQAARDLSSSRLLLHQSLADGSSLTDLILAKDQGRIRIFSEHVVGADGMPVRDGFIAATGAATPWLQRCP